MVRHIKGNSKGFSLIEVLASLLLLTMLFFLLQFLLDFSFKSHDKVDEKLVVEEYTKFVTEDFRDQLSGVRRISELSGTQGCPTSSADYNQGNDSTYAVEYLCIESGKLFHAQLDAQGNVATQTLRDFKDSKYPNAYYTLAVSKEDLQTYKITINAVSTSVFTTMLYVQPYDLKFAAVNNQSIAETKGPARIGYWMNQ
jgi:hypothetical protein